MKRNIYWLIIIVVVGLRIFAFYNSRPSYPDGTRIKITDRVLSDPIRYEASQRIYLAGYKFYLPLFLDINYGDEIIVDGVVDGKDKLKNARLLEKRKDGQILFALRRELVGFYQRTLPSAHSALVSGVTIGSKVGISPDFWESMQKSGTTHIVVASGTNVTLLTGFLMSFLLSVLPRRRAIPLALVGVWSYTAISGFDAPIIRAAIMGSIAFSAQELGRVYFAWRALILSALVMVFVKPQWFGDLGFILSFVATASLMLFEGKINRLMSLVKWPRVLGFLKRDLSTTLAAQIGVAPILFVTFGQFRLLSPIVNAIVLWTIPLITVIGLVGGIVGLVFEPLGKLVLLLCYPLTSWFMYVVKQVG
ncbi:MAG: ComEC/Rec2 family competence protein [Candidatus Hermodarchaeia archaeon]|jgi:competence protein ComEC